MISYETRDTLTKYLIGSFLIISIVSVHYLYSIGTFSNLLSKDTKQVAQSKTNDTVKKDDTKKDETSKEDSSKSLFSNVTDVTKDYKDVTEVYSKLINGNKPLNAESNINENVPSNIKDLYSNNRNVYVKAIYAGATSDGKVKVDLTNCGVNDCRIDLVLRKNNRIFIVAGGLNEIKSHTQVTVKFDKKSTYYDLGVNKTETYLDSLEVIVSSKLNGSKDYRCFNVGNLDIP